MEAKGKVVFGQKKAKGERRTEEVNLQIVLKSLKLAMRQGTKKNTHAHNGNEAKVY